MSAGIDYRSGQPISRPDDSFDDPQAHDGHPHPDRWPQASRWQTARMVYPLMAAARPDRPGEGVWARAWTIALDARIRVNAAAGRPVAGFTASDESWERGVVAIGKGPRRVLRVRRPGSRD